MLWGWVARILGPLLLLHFARRLSYANAHAPPHDRSLNALAANLLVRPGDILLCKGGSADSCTVAAWSLSEWTHVALVGPDGAVYDMTPGANERRMSLWAYVRAYEGWVCWVRRDPPITWHDPGPREFRDDPTALVLATLAAGRWGDAIRALLGGRFRRAEREPRAICSEYVATVLGLPTPAHTHPADFAPGGRYGGEGPVVLLTT